MISLSVVPKTSTESRSGEWREVCRVEKWRSSGEIIIVTNEPLAPLLEPSPG